MTTTPHRIELADFPGNKRIAVTTSWDDGLTYDRWVVQVLNELGMKGTFCLNSGRLGRTGVPLPDGTRGPLDAAEIAELYAGHEVAVHTVNHPSLDRLDPLEIITEVLEDRKALEDLVGYPVRGMSYPNGAYNARVIEVLRACGIVYSRTTEMGSYRFPPAEPLAWAPAGHILRAGPSMPEKWEALHQNPRSRGVFYFWAHSYEFAEDRENLMRVLSPLARHDDVWYCTNIELFDYEAARQRLAIAANRQSVFNPSAVPVTITVDGTVRDIPPGLTRLDEEG